MTTPFVQPRNHVLTVFLGRERVLPGVSFVVALPARGGDILRRVFATIGSGMKMLRSALKPSRLRQRVVMSFGKRFNVY